MAETKTAPVVATPKKFASESDLKVMLATSYQNQIVNFMGDKDRAMRFLSSVMAAVQRNPKLLDCTPTSVINSFMTMAQLNFMPSDVSGEGFVIPYKNGKTQESEASFQIGYQGLITLFYRGGVKKVFADIVRLNDVYEMVDGNLIHKIDLTKSMKDRGEPIGAYAKFTLPSGEIVTKYMNAADIMAHGKKFSKSFDKYDSPWKASNDPELWMWKKTVLIQGGRLVPKSDEMAIAMAEDYKDSTVGEPKLMFNLDECKKKIEDCKNTKDLAAVWSMLPGEAKADIRLIEAKNEKKKEFVEEEMAEPKVDDVAHEVEVGDVTQTNLPDAGKK